MSGPSAHERVLMAFAKMILTHGYDDISVLAIIERADIGRSTFYEHFENKDDVLRQSIAPILTPLASTLAERYDHDRLVWTLNHIAEVGDFSRAILGGRTREITLDFLANALETYLANRPPSATGLRLPFTLAAAGIAAAHISLIVTWLNDRTCSANDLAHALRRISLAMSAAV